MNDEMPTPKPDSSKVKGIKRIPYFLLALVIISALLIPLAIFAQSEEQMTAGRIFIGLALLYPIQLRLRNIGMNPWWCLVVFVPIISLLLHFRCVFYQENYMVEKKLDKNGKIGAAATFLIALGAALYFTQ